MKETRQNIGVRLKEFRKSQNLSVPELERILGIPKDRIYKWEKGTVPYDTADLEKVEKFINGKFGNIVNEPTPTYLSKRQVQKNQPSSEKGVPIYDVPIDASFIERVRDEAFEPLYYLNIPRLRNCDFGSIVTGSSMYPIIKSGSIALCRIVDRFEYFDPGEMYYISTVNGFETVKYVQLGDNKDELILIPHNEKIKPATIHKSMILKMCIVEAWLSFR